MRIRRAVGVNAPRDPSSNDEAQMTNVLQFRDTAIPLVIGTWSFDIRLGGFIPSARRGNYGFSGSITRVRVKNPIIISSQLCWPQVICFDESGLFGLPSELS